MPFVSRQHQASAWRARGEELRTIADALKDASARASLIAQAERWEEMAARTEEAAVSAPDTPIYRTMVGEFTVMLQTKMGCVQIFDRSANALHVVIHTGLPDPFVRCFGSVPANSSCWCARAMRSYAPVLIRDTNSDTSVAEFRDDARRCGFRGVLSVPFRARRLGSPAVISAFFHDPPELSPALLAAASTYANAAADDISAVEPKYS